MILFLILGLLLGAVVVVFAIQNITPVTVTFLTWDFHGSLALVLVLAVVVGILISILVSLPDVVRKSLMISKLKSANTKLNDELVNKAKEIDAEKSKLDANNAYIDDIEKKPMVK